MKTYSGDIVQLKENQIFVFGSNTQGRHGKGAALFAKQNCGAIYGQARGLQGQSYAIVTKDLTQLFHPSVPVISILIEIDRLYTFAKLTPEKEFLIAYKGNVTTLNGYSPLEMSKMFFVFSDIPSNIIFEESFYNLQYVGKN